MIWDLGGTLLDTYPVVDRALAGAVQEGRGGGPVTDADLHAVAVLTRVSSGHAITTLAQRHGIPQEDLRAAYEATKETWRHDPPPVTEGAREVMGAVHAAGGLNLVATHRDRESASELLEQVGLRVDDLVCAPDGFPRKPDPAMVVELLTRHRLRPALVLAVGDRPADVAAAETAGVRGILLQTPGVELEAPGAERITSLRELVGLVEAPS
ncbi:HAD-IA family hydrolase [Ornithinimicrobium avium]|uniref:HAD-IA family hydrolase n=1 Tax=Ornithinimicrobium avium TaxID=2283195 RepID=UPI001D18AA58|nr:HAD-IA family hydrolase [Ornithinimicrobium avium]